MRLTHGARIVQAAHLVRENFTERRRKRRGKEEEEEESPLCKSYEPDKVERKEDTLLNRRYISDRVPITSLIST